MSASMDTRQQAPGGEAGEAGERKRPGRWSPRRRRALLALAFLLALPSVKALWFFAARTDARALTEGGERADLMARRAYVVRRALEPGFGPTSFPAAVGDPFRGEWALVTLSMTGLAVANLARTFPDTRGDAAVTLRALSDRALTPELRAFDTNRWGADALETLDGHTGHIGYLGHLAILLSLEAELRSGDASAAAPDEARDALRARVAQALRHKLEVARCDLAETYPGEQYVPDNAVALAALAIGERAASSEPQGYAKARLAALRSRYEQQGLLAFRVADECHPTTTPRASGAAWSGAYLMRVDPAYAAALHATIRDRFLDAPLPGVWGLREYPRGDRTAGDVDSGQLIVGLSPAATAFGISLARGAGDVSTLQHLLDTAELAGFTVGRSERRYLTCPVVGDAVVLAMKTANRLDSPDGSIGPCPCGGSGCWRAGLRPCTPAGRRGSAPLVTIRLPTRTDRSVGAA
jgi:hypothetical protein